MNQESDRDLMRKIIELKRKKNAVILAHYYQISEIQDIADYIGDSLGLAQNALQTQSKIIVFAGVHFMAETAKIINPYKKVLLPDLKAGCSLADSCPANEFRIFIKEHPDHKVISYINCSAEIKALSDVICTSGNALKIVESFPKNQKIIFAPDKNLGNYINQISGRKMLLWDGICEVHHIIKTEAILKLKIKHPEAKLIAHPECQAVILEIADFIGSTTALLNYTIKSKDTKFIVATETGILHQMRKNSPDKQFLIVPADNTCSCNDCPYMKMNTLKNVYSCLENETPEIILQKTLMAKARKPIMKMLELSV